MAIGDLKLIGDKKLLCKDIEVETKQKKNKSGIILSEDTQKTLNKGLAYDDHPYQAEVLNVSSDVKNIKAGDRIAYRPGSGEGFLYDADTYVILSEHECYLVYD